MPELTDLDLVIKLRDLKEEFEAVVETYNEGGMGLKQLQSEANYYFDAVHTAIEQAGFQGGQA